MTSKEKEKEKEKIQEEASLNFQTLRRLSFQSLNIAVEIVSTHSKDDFHSMIKRSKEVARFIKRIDP